MVLFYLKVTHGYIGDTFVSQRYYSLQYYCTSKILLYRKHTILYVQRHNCHLKILFCLKNTFVS